MASEVFEAAAGTLLECTKEVIQPGIIRIYKYQQVKKVQNFDSGKIAVEALHNARWAVVDPESFKVAKIKLEPKNKKREWRTNL